MLLNTLIFICGAILLVGTIVTTFVWFKYRHPLIKNLLFFWLSGILSFIAQGIFNNLEISGFLAFAINWMTITFFLKIFADGLDLRLPFRIYHMILGGSIAIGAGLLAAGFSYTVGSFVFCLAGAGVIFHGALSKLKTTHQDPLSLGYRFILIFDGLHFLDYPFVRPDVNLSVIGFSFTIVFFFCFAVFVPIFILRRISADYTQQLENEVEVRTRQLNEANEQLNNAFADLKSSKGQVETLLVDNQRRMSALVHDISTPLQILFYNFFLMTTDFDRFTQALPEKKPRIEIAIKSIKQILVEAKDTHSGVMGKSSVSISQINLEVVVDELLRVFEDKLQEKKIQIEVRLEALKGIQVLGHEAWLKNQVLANLLSNAIKFSPLGGKIKIHGYQSQDNKVCICIADNGVGISSDKKEKLFDLNQITTSLGTLGEQGTGLGLPIVKQYSELMGGKVHLLETSAKGTCFEVQLPKAA